VNGSKGWRQIFSRFGVTYNFEGQNRALFADSLLERENISGINDEFLNGFSHDVNMQTTASFFKNTVKLTPSLRYGNKMNFQQVDKWYTQSDSLIVDRVPTFGMAHELTFNAQLTTVVYSYYRFIGKNKPIVRHVLTPSFGYRQTPNLNTIVDTAYVLASLDTVNLTYSPFEQSAYAVSQTRGQRLLTFGFNNTLELKRKSDKDTVDGFKRTRLIDAFSITGIMIS
jgi:hypothetical protein